MAVAGRTGNTALAETASHAFVSGMTAAALVGTVVAVAGALVAWLLLPNGEAAPKQAPAPAPRQVVDSA
jgi:hypothetical protein